ncbi:LAFA_0A01090g1_1 [Lachancea sp. 'fantastica']|nr:LAFA_0A01090g1_1 [Lachancea sp. 'fantastica']
MLSIPSHQNRFKFFLSDFWFVVMFMSRVLAPRPYFKFSSLLKEPWKSMRTFVPFEKLASQFFLSKFANRSLVTGRASKPHSLARNPINNTRGSRPASRNPYLNKVTAREPKTFTMSVENTTKEPAKATSKPIVWVDCEMTGLDHTKDKIIEICCIITDGDLNVVDEDGYESVVHCDKSLLDGMDEWCVEHHGSSGLTEKVLQSTKTTQQVEDELLAYVQRWVPAERRGILAGNTVHMDRLFMLREFPKVVKHLFYRIIDVSTIMEVSFRHNPELASVFPRKKGAHTAKADILESIEQLRWYRKHYLKDSSETRDFVAQRRAELDAENKPETQQEENKQNDTATSLSSVLQGVKKSAQQALGSLRSETRDKNSTDGQNEENPVKKQRLD